MINYLFCNRPQCFKAGFYRENGQALRRKPREATNKRGAIV
ncbi:hypothetical protein ALO56_101302 [Pseudomonas viridiflava]|uniref:Uncharacterized protein n=1 Tax=Pseudomonas syringae pv. ribicola TaxID=55398 RepID=A0A0P9YIV4_PSESI|nr:hypothetical protein ALO47_101269 [Pseudomonas syringae pv. ribicola]KPZ17002.1 hypothetical protein ALO56_101302 [Pseudomonas viridiflava]